MYDLFSRCNKNLIFFFFFLGRVLLSVNLVDHGRTEPPSRRLRGRGFKSGCREFPLLFSGGPHGVAPTRRLAIKFAPGRHVGSPEEVPVWV